MRSRAAAIALALVVAAPGLPLAGAADRPARIGFLSSGSAATTGRYADTFVARLDELGFRLGTTLAVEYRWGEGRYERLPALAAELASHDVDVFLASSEAALLAAKAQGRNLPIVTVSCDPLERLLGSLARPGGNATGYSCTSSELDAKRIGLLRDIVPALTDVAVLLHEDDAKLADRGALEAGAAGLGLRLHPVAVRTAEDLAPAFARMAALRAGALLVSPGGFTTFHQKRLAALALEHRLPAIFGFRDFAEAGGLMSYGASLDEGFRIVAGQVARILRGARPQDLPIAQPTEFTLLVNARTAAALGLAIPPALLARASEVIE